MSRIKRSFLLLLTILIMIGVSGCMSVEQDYKEPIQNYLKEKYGCDFVVHKAAEGFSGSDGKYVYALCESLEYVGKTFGVYCYSVAGEERGDSIAFGEETFFIYDKYAEVCFTDQMRQEIKELLPTDVFVECKIKFDCGYALHYSVTQEQFRQGMDFCLNSKEFYSYVTIYIVTDENADIDLLQGIVEDYCSKYNAHEQYLYFATSPNMDKEIIVSHFNENSEKFGSHMLDCDVVKEVKCTEMNRDKGIVERTIEKR